MYGLPAGLMENQSGPVIKDYSERFIDPDLLASYMPPGLVDPTLSDQIAAFSLFLHSEKAPPAFFESYTMLGDLSDDTVYQDGIAEYLQFNPARERNIVDFQEKSRKRTACFLCPEKMCEDEVGIRYGGRLILGNLYPYLDDHLVVIETSHAPQQLGSQLPTMLEMAQKVPDMFFFYNGPEVGATAPDHPHFQGGRKIDIPLLETLELRHRQESEAKIPLDIGIDPRRAETYIPTRVGRTAIVVRGYEPEDVHAGVANAVQLLAQMPESDGFIDINCSVTSIHQSLAAIILPRTAFRDPKFDCEDTPFFTPAACELMGRWPVPIRRDFDAVTGAQLQEIAAQVSLSKAAILRQAGRLAMAKS